jgi:hypothetical protein
MAQKTGAFDSRDVLSLIAAILSVIVFACFWQFREAHASLPYALYQYMVRPVAAISIPFFISSHFRIIRLPRRALFIPKAVCCMLGIAYILLVAILLKAGGDTLLDLIMAAYAYIPVYVPYLAASSGLILGARQNIPD